MIKAWRQARAYNRARLQIISLWRRAGRGDQSDAYTRGYTDGLDRAVRTIASELTWES